MTTHATQRAGAEGAERFTDLVDVAAERLGGAVLAANDEFFAPKENLIKPGAPQWREGEYTERGKWMDGWETRRRRSAGYDWCLVRLGLPSVIRGIVVDTSFFRGNYPEECSVEACALPGVPRLEMLLGDAAPWKEIVPRSALRGDAHNAFAVAGEERFTHLRLNIFPDGGVARLRVFGEPRPDLSALRPDAELDLAAMESGGLVLVCSDMFFGHRHNLVMPGRSTHMGDGWETKRRRGPGHDWTIVRLAGRGVIRRIELDTDHFKGNAPEACAIDVCDAAGAPVEALTNDVVPWRPLLAKTHVQPHARHRFEAPAGTAPATHARLSIYPDGGVARLRLFGTLAR